MSSQLTSDRSDGLAGTAAHSSNGTSTDRPTQDPHTTQPEEGTHVLADSVLAIFESLLPIAAPIFSSFV
ncbi:hypothetical protein [Streptomyces sp. NPDC052494]|uniref:hypothetical protein n=1 Tax=Streptomyces sp. NPDC052494 TaxID=3365692 RepID=UPI0037D24A37